MAARGKYRIQKEIIDADQLALQRVSDLGDYSPFKGEFSLEALRAHEAAMVAACQAEDRIMYEAELAREQALAAIWTFHTAMKGLKAQVVAQYGEESLAIHAVGRKRPSERRQPVRRPRAE